jgi:uncharacterized protein
MMGNSTIGKTSMRRPTQRFFYALVLLTVLGAAGPRSLAQERPQHLPTITVRAGIHHIRAQVASSPEQRTTGLMYRKNMPQNEGMLFVFAQPDTQCFWMKNTPLPLSAAFVADDGSVVNIEDMQPLSLATHCSKKPVRYVLEMNQGWFKKRGVAVGAKLEGLPGPP